ncbi:MAG: hypothetical protein MUC96_07495 [Myxococcaceae bacterium]|jgi:hypothetical protein|nr:hypothetical protein [Myxococcaceae bacterium]
MTDELSDRARALVDAAKQQGGPSAAQQAKMAAVIAATSSTAAALGSSGAVVASTSVTKLVGAGVLAALVGIGGTVVVSKAVGPERPRAGQGAPASASPDVAPRSPSEVAKPTPAAVDGAEARGPAPTSTVASPQRDPGAIEAKEPASPPGPPRAARAEETSASERTVTAPRPTGGSGPVAEASRRSAGASPGIVERSAAAPASPAENARATARSTGGDSATPSTSPTGGDSPRTAPPLETSPAVERAAAGSPGERPATGRVTGTDTTAAEVTALATAMEALDTKDFAQALRIARTTRRAHPTGALRPELTLLEVEALCGLSRVDEAQDVLDAMPQVDRTALVQERLRRTCVSLK